MYGILSSKLHNIFIRRSANSTSRHVDFTAVCNSQTQMQPPVRLMYLYMLHLASMSVRLDPRERHATASGDKWVGKSRKRGHVTAGMNLNSDDDHDADDSDDTTGGTAGGTSGGPANHISSKTNASATSQAIGSSGARHHAGSQHEVSKLAKLLLQLPRVLRNTLDIGLKLGFGECCVVRHSFSSSIRDSSESCDPTCSVVSAMFKQDTTWSTVCQYRQEPCFKC